MSQIQFISDQERYKSSKEGYKSLNELLKNHYVAKNAFDVSNDIFRSNPSHNSTFVAHPNYYIDWAKSKHLDVSWLDWARARRLVNASKMSTPAVIDSSEKSKPTGKRLGEGLKAAKRLLQQTLSSNELHDVHNFKKCMKKSNVIDFIRANPLDYPECANTNTKSPESRSIADREPSLSRIFPDFTKHPEIISEYKRLIDEE
jgi:hypothetical protein